MVEQNTVNIRIDVQFILRAIIKKKVLQLVFKLYFLVNKRQNQKLIYHKDLFFIKKTSR
jgi:hypothetical protein